jgi:hypothetical protein
MQAITKWCWTNSEQRVKIALLSEKSSEAIQSRSLVVAQSQVSASLKNLQKMFKYYRLSLYTFSLASLIEIMLSGNFKEEYIAGIKTELETLSNEYRDLYQNCSVYLEKKSGVAIERNLLKASAVQQSGREVHRKIPVV